MRGVPLLFILFFFIWKEGEGACCPDYNPLNYSRACSTSIRKAVIHFFSSRTRPFYLTTFSISFSICCPAFRDCSRLCSSRYGSSCSSRQTRTPLLPSRASRTKCEFWATAGSVLSNAKNRDSCQSIKNVGTRKSDQSRGGTIKLRYDFGSMKSEFVEGK